MKCRVEILLKLTISIVFFSDGPITAQDFCALKVVVAYTDGSPASDVIIELRDDKGVIVDKHRTVGDSTTFCDFGPGAHTVKVGPNECFPSELSNVRLVYGKNQTLHVALNSCPAGEILTNACDVLFRVRDPENRPIEKADIAEYDRLRYTDRFGRAASKVPMHSSRQFTVEARGFESQKITLGCENSTSIDQLIVLHPAHDQ